MIHPLFGSVATGTATAASDVGLMVYRPHLDDDQVESWDQQVAELLAAVERWTGNPCEILEIDPLTLIEMTAQDEPVLRSPRVPISSINIAAASPNFTAAKNIQAAMSSSAATKALRKVVSQHFNSDISPELQRTITELHKVSAGSEAMESIRRQQMERFEELMKTPGKGAVGKQRR